MHSSVSRPQVLFALLAAANPIASAASSAATSTLSPREDFIGAVLHNNCGFNVYVHQVVAQYAGSRIDEKVECRGFKVHTTIETVGPYESYKTPLPVYRDTCGHSSMYSFVFVGLVACFVRWFAVMFSLLPHHTPPNDATKNLTNISPPSHKVKVSRVPNGKVYQYEFNWSLEDGRIWYNLSHNDANPFTDVARQIGGPKGSSCQYRRCHPGNNGEACDDPLLGDCGEVGTLVAYLC
ncbi:hypothetical protein IAQ61_009021 [Plenodomus lingam]|uniref:uncharacterized protein n=1 Tax=Leptosphaeria maculans TaxID=5022 RepID=UPI003321E1D3|nr:hypothetical protein IAQ61_009021 [Plenodomus lingam]